MLDRIAAGIVGLPGWVALLHGSHVGNQPRVAPNSRRLERRFADLDNFYANAEVSAQGWNWDVAANSNPYTEQTWAANYSNRHHPYPSESSDAAIAPNIDLSDAYIWDRLADRHISFRNYGFYVSPDANNREVATDPRLEAHTDPAFRGFDLKCPDSPGSFAAQSTSCGSPRFTEWDREFQGYVKNHDQPTMEFVRLPSDHTAATAPGKPTPTAYVADNDWALGRLVDAVSHSPYWKSTAIFVTEDDAQEAQRNGPVTCLFCLRHRRWVTSLACRSSRNAAPRQSVGGATGGEPARKSAWTRRRSPGSWPASAATPKPPQTSSSGTTSASGSTPPQEHKKWPVPAVPKRSCGGVKPGRTHGYYARLSPPV